MRERKTPSICPRCGHLRYVNSNYHDCPAKKEVFAGTFEDFLDEDMSERDFYIRQFQAQQEVEREKDDLRRSKPMTTEVSEEDMSDELTDKAREFAESKFEEIEDILLRFDRREAKIFNLSSRLADFARQVAADAVREERKRMARELLSGVCLCCQGRIYKEFAAELGKGAWRRVEDGLPIDIVLFCPNCKTQHIDKAEPDVCESCGHEEIEHFGHNGDDPNDIGCYSCGGIVPNGCQIFTAWLNPPHKSHRCHNCNTVWRPADVPTNGVEKAKTGGDNDTKDWGVNPNEPYTEEGQP